MPRKQRRRTWGSITTVSRCKHVLRWVENTPEGRRRRSLTFYGTYKEADAELAKIRVKVGDDAPVPTVGQAYELWWLPRASARLADGTMAANTYRLYTNAWNNVAAPKWSRTPVDSIKPVSVQEWLRTLSKGNAHHAMAVLKQTVDFAVQYETVDSNKFRIPYDMPAKPSKTRDRDVYDIPRAEAMLDRMRGERAEAAYILAAFGSCRTGESLGVMANEVRAVESRGLVFAVASVSRQMDALGCEPLEILKTDKSARSVVVPPPYSERLLEIASERKAAGSEWMADRGDGLPMNKRMLGTDWHRIAAPDYIPFSNLRNSWRTFGQAVWRIDFDVLEMLMGHAIPGVTGRHYLRMSEEQLVAAFADDFAKYART